MSILDGGGLLVDAGAHVGTVAIPVAVAGSDVVAIEMNPGNWLRLHASARANCLDRFRIIEAAANDVDGEVNFDGSEAWGRVTYNASDRVVPATTIDALLNGIEPVPGKSVAFKVDVEGHELKVFQGARQAITRLRPYIVFESIDCEGESQSDAYACRQYIVQLGYDLFLIRGKILAPTMPADIREGLVGDYLAVPKELRATFSAPDFYIRALSDEERLTWVADMVAADRPHQRHAAGIVLRWKREKPGLYAASSAIIASLSSLAHLSDLHDQLRRPSRSSMLPPAQ